MKKAEKKAQKLGVEAVVQARGGIKITSSIKAGLKGASPIKF